MTSLPRRDYNNATYAAEVELSPPINRGFFLLTLPKDSLSRLLHEPKLVNSLHPLIAFNLHTMMTNILPHTSDTETRFYTPSFLCKEPDVGTVSLFI